MLAASTKLIAIGLVDGVSIIGGLRTVGINGVTGVFVTTEAVEVGSKIELGVFGAGVGDGSRTISTKVTGEAVPEIAGSCSLFHV